MLAAAAEGIDFAHFAAQAAPDLERDAAAAMHQVIHDVSGPAPRGASAPTGAAAPVRDLTPLQAAAIPPLARPETPPPGPAHPETPSPDRAPLRGAAGGGVAAASRAPVGGAAGGSSAAERAPAVSPGGPHHAGTPGDAVELLRYPGDGASPRRIAEWMGIHAARAGLPPELPVMAALTESGLRDTPTGDRDSVGFFQMRTSIWDSGRYAGFERRPGLQLQWFIDQALAVRGAHADDQSYGRDPSSWGNWIADVEQSAAEYRGRYQLQLDSARELLRGLDLSAPGAPSPAEVAVHTALGFVGTPYVWGGASPAGGFDCSGLVQYAYGHAGIALPRVAADQFATGTPVERSDLRRGDVVFFRDGDGVVHHEGIYLGGGRFIHAPQTREDIKVSRLDEPYFAAQYTGARRFAGLSSTGDASRYARSLPAVSG
jgi:hypothetical protein